MEQAGCSDLSSSDGSEVITEVEADLPFWYIICYANFLRLLAECDCKFQYFVEHIFFNVLIERTQ